MIKFKKVRDVKSPERAHSTDSGIDFYVPIWWWRLILWWENVIIPLWIVVELPKWFDLTFTNKSGIASKTWLITWACLIDNWYRGELALNLINTSKYSVEIKEWQKIIQGVIRAIEYFPLEEVVELGEITERWERWFGSTWI